MFFRLGEESRDLAQTLPATSLIKFQSKVPILAFTPVQIRRIGKDKACSFEKTRRQVDFLLSQTGKVFLLTVIARLRQLAETKQSHKVQKAVRLPRRLRLLAMTPY